VFRSSFAGAACVLLFTAALAAQTFSPNVRIGAPAGDDWEAAAAIDNVNGYLYTIYLHQNDGQTLCSGCGQHEIIQSSTNGGAAWSAPVMPAPGPYGKGGQFDPSLYVDPATGKLYFTFMQGIPGGAIDMVTSTDHGVTWTSPQVVSGSITNTDKDLLAVSGQTLAVCFDDYYHVYGSVSTNGGATWTVHTIQTWKNAPQQLLCSGAGIDSQGNIYFAYNEYNKTTNTNPSTLWIYKSSNGGVAWTTIPIDQGGAPYACRHCGAGAYLAPQIAMKIGPDDTIYVLYNDTPDATNGAPERIYFRKSTDHGATFSARVDVSQAPTGVEHSFPMVAVGTAASDVRLAWEDRRTGSWNVYYKESTNAGATFTNEVRVSDNAEGYSYQTSTGFLFPYGDYFQMVVDAKGKTHLAWGEAPAYTSAGNIFTAAEQ